MKRKIFSILFALVLVLSLSLVTAVPVAAQVTEVWVDDDFTAETEGWKITHFASIQDGINAVAEGGTVNVLTGTYKEHIVIDKSNLSLIGEDRETTVIDATQDPSWPVAKPGILIGEYPVVNGVDGVTVSGFTIRDAEMQEEGAPYGGKKYAPGPQAQAGILIYNSSDNTIENNILSNNHWQIFVCAEWPATGYTECRNNRIANNIIMDSEEDGVYLYSDGGVSVQDTEIINNKISNADGEQASGIDFWGWPEGGPTPTIIGTVIRGNNIANCTYGVRIKDVSDITGTSVNYNNIFGNREFGVLSTIDSIDATNNWWGTAIKSQIAKVVSGNVDYSPWLDAAYPDGKPTSLDVTTISLASGWNLISLPLIPEPEASSIETVLDGVDVNKVAYYIGGPKGSWLYYTGDLATSDLLQMQDGKGYWIDMNTAGALTIRGYELCAPPPAVPPSYNLVEGWNLIGFKSLATDTVEAYFGAAVTNTMEGMYGYDAAAGLYTIIKSMDTLVPGDGYWLAVSADGTIYP